CTRDGIGGTMSYFNFW
nr:immunoglobulin heavy chain junction region [Macaca mulatta]